MCFSATASFVASAGLGIVGVLTVVKVRDARTLPMAAIPLWFSLQQFIEGGLWLTLSSNPLLTLPFTYFFLFFALLWWPIYVPLSVYLVEKVFWRKKIMAILGIVGIGIGSYIFGLFLTRPLPATVINSCLHYQTNNTHELFWGILYIVVAIGAGLISSHKVIVIASGLAGLLAVISWFLYTANFISVWCFFAAIASLFIYFFFDLKYSLDHPPKLSKIKKPGIATINMVP
jgi:hypothetical protein